MNVVCIGSGYVGSVTGAAFAALGHNTTIIDIDMNKVNSINMGKSPIYEPGLDDLIQKFIGPSFFATTSYEAVEEADIVFIGVGTPSREDGTADLIYIKRAAESIGDYLNPHKFTVVVNKSTVPIGTSDLVSSIIEEKSGLRADVHFAVVSNPEFLREGFALQDVFFPDRIVIGSDNETAKKMMKTLYYDLLKRVNFEQILSRVNFKYDMKAPLAIYFESDTKSAEMIKYASNAFLAVKISYINEIARMCEMLGANVLEVAYGMGLDTRIGNKFLQVSSGWSGSCFPKDTAELLATSQKYGSELTVVKAAMTSNKQMHHFIVEKVKRQLKTLNGKRIGIFGLTFKPDTDDARHTQASVIIKELIDAGVRIRAHDPQGMEMFKQMNHELDIHYCENAEEVPKNVDALILLTHWEEYRQLDWTKALNLMKTPYILDTRNYLFCDTLEKIGFKYEGIGIGSKEKRMVDEKVLV